MKDEGGAPYTAKLEENLLSGEDMNNGFDKELTSAGVKPSDLDYSENQFNRISCKSQINLKTKDIKGIYLVI